MRKRFGAWIRYGEPVSEEQADFAAEHYSVAILQPWETAVADRLKSSGLTTLCYKCLSSTRSYESGPIVSSGVSHDEAEEVGEEWFAHRLDGHTRIEWARYGGHWQMAVWNDEYRARWCDNVVDELEDSVWDGVMADNDVYDDYYALNPPIEGGRVMADLRSALDEFVAMAGERLNRIGKILVPNIAEARREQGRWHRHARYGGGFEEVWLAYEADRYLDPSSALDQVDEIRGPGLSIVRTASDGTNTHPNFKYGLAAFWVFGGREHGAFAATAHDGYSTTPYIPELDWDLGEPLGDASRRGNSWTRTFANGWAAVNMNTNPRRKTRHEVPEGLSGVDGQPAPRHVTLGAHTGALYRS